MDTSQENQSELIPENQSELVSEKKNENKPESLSLAESVEIAEDNIEKETDQVLAEGEQIINTIPAVSAAERQEFSSLQGEISTLRDNVEEQLEGSLETGKKTPENFANAARILLNTLRFKEKSAEEGYVFAYDPITEKTSQGREIKVDSLSWISDDGFATDNKRRLACIATDLADGKVVGLRLSDIRKDGMSREEDGRYVNHEKITGEILTRFRGEGIAPALDKAFEKVLIQVANYYKQEFAGDFKFSWSVENANLKRLNQKREDGLSSPELKELEMEQKRWQSVYGEGGKMGFQKVAEYDYKKTIEPQMEAGKNYDLQRVDIKKFKEIEAALEEFAEKD